MEPGEDAVVEGGFLGCLMCLLDFVAGVFAVRAQAALRGPVASRAAVPVSTSAWQDGHSQVASHGAGSSRRCCSRARAASRFWRRPSSRALYSSFVPVLVRASVIGCQSLSPKRHQTGPWGPWVRSWSRWVAMTGTVPVKSHQLSSSEALGDQP
ncbi:hypothetical protein ACWD7C_42160 [Streptomyces sp. NPDC005134]|uniref:hypothetical protein n=1 Tax=unclassified Streptomyces TaxID=2593676 RepID=UPI0033A8B71C